MDHPSNTPDPVRSPRALLTTFLPLRRELSDLVRNPVAFVGGILGTLALGGALAAALMIDDAKADEASDDLVLDVDFNPGSLVRMGAPRDPDAIPEKEVVDDTVAAPASTSEVKVTLESDAKPPIERPDEPAKDPVKPPKQPPEPKPPGTKVAETNQTGNNPYKDPATASTLPGDPFGSPDGWADLAKDGDPWATGVVGALNKMKVPSYAAQQLAGVFQFQIEICGDGSISRVTTKKSTGDLQLDKMLVSAVTATKIPLPPASVAAQLKGGCKKIPYKFTWQSGGKVE